MRALLLTVVLGASFTPSRAFAAECGAPVRDVEIVTLNAWGLPSPIAQKRRDRFPRIQRFIERHEFDLVGLQEVWRGALSLFAFDGLVRDHDRGDSGLALVTPHPVTSTRTRTFRAARGFDRFKDKGLLMNRVDLPDFGPVEVWVTHLQAGHGGRNALVRSRQVDEILDQARGVDVPVVLMGDFNFYEGNAIDQGTRYRLEASGLLDAAEAVGNHRATHVVDAERYDRVYVRSETRRCVATRSVTVVDYDDDPSTGRPPFLSDHLPVRATLGLAVAE